MEYTGQRDMSHLLIMIMREGLHRAVLQERGYSRVKRGVKDGVLACDKARTEEYRYNAPMMHRKSKDTLVISPLIEKKYVRNWRHK